MILKDTLIKLVRSYINIGDIRKDMVSDVSLWHKAEYEIINIVDETFTVKRLSDGAVENCSIEVIYKDELI